MNPILLCLEYTFKKNNFEVFIARDGQEALDILEKQFRRNHSRCNDAYGWWFCHIRTNKKDERLQHCKVIFLSAKTKERILKGLSLESLCNKPFSIKKLVEQVQELIQ
jgi:DNA-binding response OmpR family regulator